MYSNEGQKLYFYANRRKLAGGIAAAPLTNEPPPGNASLAYRPVNFPITPTHYLPLLPLRNHFAPAVMYLISTTLQDRQCA